MIGWSFLDKQDATIRALKDYDSMKFIVDNTSAEIRMATERAASVGVACYEEHIRGGNKQSGEDRMIAAIEEIDTLKERYRQAVEYLNWFEPAWKQLSEEEQYILESCYLDEMPYLDVCDHLGIEKSSFYIKKKRALNHLKTLLYGVL